MWDLKLIRSLTIYYEIISQDIYLKNPNKN